jgi:hypothetical protein
MDELSDQKTVTIPADVLMTETSHEVLVEECGAGTSNKAELLGLSIT